MFVTQNRVDPRGGAHHRVPFFILRMSVVWWRRTNGRVLSAPSFVKNKSDTANPTTRTEEPQFTFRFRQPPPHHVSEGTHHLSLIHSTLSALCIRNVNSCNVREEGYDQNPWRATPHGCSPVLRHRKKISSVSSTAFWGFIPAGPTTPYLYSGYKSHQRPS